MTKATQKAKWLKLKKEIQSVMGKGFICDNGGNRLGSTSEFYGGEETYRGFWCDGESRYEFKNTGMAGTDYYAFDIPGLSKHYSKDGSILDEFYDWLSDRGLYCEWHDCGTVMIYFS
jgi:hypothetical protein